MGPAVVQALRGAGYEVTALTEPSREALVSEARKALLGRPDGLVVVGGDGMVHLGANLVAGTTVPLGIVPSGTGNDTARALGIPHNNTERAIRTSNRRRPVCSSRPARVLGGGMKITPDALIDDGMLDVLVVEHLTRVQFLCIFPRVFNGTHLTDPRVTVRRAKRITIDADAVAAYADGERVGPLPIEIEVVLGALRVLAPLP